MIDTTDAKVMAAAIAAAVLIGNVIVWLVFIAWAKLPNSGLKAAIWSIVYHLDRFADDMDNPTKRAKAISDLREVLTWKKYLIPAALIGWLIDAEVAAIRKMQASCGAETNLHNEEGGGEI